MELIERDLFLCRYLTQTPFFEIQPSDDLFDKVIHTLKNQGIILTFFSMGILNSAQTVLCAIEGLRSHEPFGYIFGTSSGDLNLAIKSSFLEAYRNFAHHKNDQSISLAEFFEKSETTKIDFTDHGNLALDPQYAEALKNDFFSSTESQEINEQIDLNLSCEILNRADTPFEDAPLSVVRVSSPNLQNLFVGNTTEKKLNVHRLKNFCKTYNRPYQVYKLPHPFN